MCTTSMDTDPKTTTKTNFFQTVTIQKTETVIEPSPAPPILLGSENVLDVAEKFIINETSGEDVANNHMVMFKTDGPFDDFAEKLRKRFPGLANPRM